MPIAFHGRSADFQDVAALGVITYRRVADPRTLTERIDFTRGTALRIEAAAERLCLVRG